MSVSGGDEILAADEIVAVEINHPPVTRTTMVVTASVKRDIEIEVDKAVETHAKSINEENCNEIFAFREHKGDIVCDVLLHAGGHNHVGSGCIFDCNYVISCLNIVSARKRHLYYIYSICTIFINYISTVCTI